MPRFFYRSSIIVYVAFFFGLFAGQAAAYDVLLDISGSMRGFQQAAAGMPNGQSPWTALVAGLAGGATNTYTFNEDFRNWDRQLSVGLFTGGTNIGNAIEGWLRESSPGASLVVITDNIADHRDGQLDASQKAFYDQIRGPNTEFDRVAVAPVRLPFCGYVYNPKDESIRKVYPVDGKGPNNKPYETHSASCRPTDIRAIAIYLLSRKKEGQGNDRKAMASVKAFLDDFFAKRLRQDEYGYLRVAPLRDDDDQSETAGQTSQPIVKSHDDEIDIVSLPDGNGQELVIQYPLGGSKAIELEVLIPPAKDFRLIDATFGSQLSLDKQSDFNISENYVKSEINPVQATLEPRVAKSFRVNFTVFGINSTGDVSFWRNIELYLSGSTYVTGNIDLHYTVSRDNVRLPDQPWKSWSYEGSYENLVNPKREIQSKLFQLGLFAQSIVQESDLFKNVAYKIPMRLKIIYSAGPLITASFIILLALILAGWFFRSIFSSGDYLVIDEAGQEYSNGTGFGGMTEVSSPDGQATIRLHSWGPVTWVSTPNCLKSSRVLLGGTSRIEVETKDDGEAEKQKYVFNRRPVRNKETQDTVDEWGE